MGVVHQDPPPAMGELREGNGAADGRHIHRRRMLPGHSRLALFLSRRLRRTSASGLGGHAADCSARVWRGRGVRGGDGRGGRSGAKASPETLVTDKLASCKATLRGLGLTACHRHGGMRVTTGRRTRT
jgi:hypothetical protein